MRASMLSVLHLHVLAFVCVASACNVTLTPTNDLANEVAAAVAVASPGPLLVCLDAGTYAGCGLNLTTADDSGVSLLGAGMGLTDIDCGNVSRFARVTSDTSITGLTVRNCRAIVGAGLLVESGSIFMDSVEITNVTWTQQITITGGGAIDISAAATAASFVRCVFSKIGPDSEGRSKASVIYSLVPVTYIDDCSFEQTGHPSLVQGAAVAIPSTSAIITNSHFSHNDASSTPACLDVRDSLIDQCVFANSVVTVTGAAVQGVRTTVSNSHFSNCTGSFGSAVSGVEAHLVNITGVSLSAVFGNFYIQVTTGVPVRLHNITVTNSFAGQVAGLFVSATTLPFPVVLTDSTFLNLDTNVNYGAVMMQTASDGHALVDGCTFSGISQLTDSTATTAAGVHLLGAGTLSNCVFDSVVSDGTPGGAVRAATNLTVDGCVFSRCTHVGGLTSGISVPNAGTYVVAGTTFSDCNAAAVYGETGSPYGFHNVTLERHDGTSTTAVELYAAGDVVFTGLQLVNCTTLFNMDIVDLWADALDGRVIFDDVDVRGCAANMFFYMYPIPNSFPVEIVRAHFTSNEFGFSCFGIDRPVGRVTVRSSVFHNSNYALWVFDFPLVTETIVTPHNVTISGDGTMSAGGFFMQLGAKLILSSDNVFTGLHSCPAAESYNGGDLLIGDAFGTLRVDGVTGSGYLGAFVADEGSHQINNSIVSDVSVGNSGGFLFAIDSASVSVSNVTLNQVGSLIDGGGIYANSGARVYVSDSLFDTVSSDAAGGAVHVRASAYVRITSSVFRDSSATSGGFAYVTGSGSEFFVESSTITRSSATSGAVLNCVGGSMCGVNSSTVVQGTAASNGGFAVCSGSAACEFHGTTVSSCEAGSSGGGLYVLDANIVADSCVFAGCSAPSGGAASFDTGTYDALRNLTFRGNTADTNGGSVEVASAHVTIATSTFISNYAVSGAAVSATAAAFPTSATLTDCNVVGNTGTTTGSAMLCVSGAECYITGSTVRDNTGSAAVYGLFEAVLGVNSTIFSGNSHEGIAAYGAASVDLVSVNFLGHGKPALYCIASPMTVVGAVIRENTGLYAVWLSSALDVSFVDTFIAANSGTGFYCSAPKDGYATTFTNSLVCDNNPDFDCASGCSVAGVPNACSTVNTTDCGRYCTEVNTEFCVADSGLFAGPYDGCFACGGECAAGNYSCPTHAVCEDTAGGVFDCACPTGFAGNGTTNCTDLDECVLGTHNCDVHASCVNTVGSFYCECDSGWEGSGVVCVDINECLTANLSVCVPGAACINIEGGHECECDDGYYGNGYVECSPCPAKAHSFVGATNLTDCECDTNTFNLDGTLGSDCVPCPPGKYVLFAQVLVCVDCPVDTYSTANNTVGACTPCPEFTSTYGASGLSSINNCSCSPGLDLVQYGSNNATRCERYCPAGTYRSTPAAPCFECVAGTFSENPNTQSCSLCPINRVTAGPGATSPNNCSCINGYFAPNGGVDEDCQRWCPAGSYRPNPFALDCILCDTGQYSSAPNSPACTDCPNNAVTTAQNATALEDCVCPANYYTPDRKVGTACVRCPEGAKCKGGVNWPIARKGFIVVESEDGTAEFAACVPSEACAGNGKCAAGYRGSLCERCEPNYYRLDGLCYECRDNAGVVVFFVALALFIFCAVLVWFNSQERALNKFASVVIGVNSLQIAAMYGRLNLHWPPFAQQFFAVLSLANFNIELVSPECAVTVSDPFVLRWLLTMFFPVVVALMFAAICGIGVALMQIRLSERWPGLADNRVLGSFFTSKWTPRYLRHTCIRAFYQLMTIGYLPLSAAVFEFFYCVKDANGTRVISTARQTACYTPVYWSLFPVALFCFFIYPVGIPVFCGFLLKSKRDKLGDIKFSIRYGFLVGRFDPEFYFFELAIMARKLGVAVAMSFLTDNSYVKAGGAVVVLVVSYTIQLRLTPYRTAVYNLMEDGCLLSSALVLLISVVFQAQGDGLELTRAVLVIVVLMGMLLIIVTGLAADAYAVFNAEREVDRMAGETAESYVSGKGSEKEFDEVSAGGIAPFDGSRPQQAGEAVVGVDPACVSTTKFDESLTDNAAYGGGAEVETVVATTEVDSVVVDLESKDF